MSDCIVVNRDVCFPFCYWTETSFRTTYATYTVNIAALFW